jgi:predicted metalloprotease with PDZ domain
LSSTSGAPSPGSSLATVYTVDCTDPGKHVYDITLDLAGLTPGVHELALPVWAPGAYEVQDFSRHVFDVKVVDGAGVAVPVDKTAKNVWRFDTVSDRVTVTYRVYAFQLAVDTSHLDGTHAYWNGTNLFFVVDGEKTLPIDVYIKAPAGWHVSTGLDRVGDDPFHFRAPNYDILADCPVEVGTHRRYTFDVLGKRHEIAIWGYGNEDPDRLVDDTRKIVEAAADLFGGLPYDHYTFILHIADAGGGLEHLNSTTCQTARTAFKPWKRYRRVLGLLSHEFFHLWNVKRIHPDMLGPFDYNREVYTHLLWAMEGFTDYYAFLLLRRSGLYSVNEYFEFLADEIKALESQPGRLVTSLARASFDTWISLYHPTPDFPNRSISYYLKGSLVGLLLDLEIRRRTDNQRSLDDVLRLLYERYGARGVGFPEEVYQSTAEEVAGGSLADFFARYIYGVDELPLDDALGWAGLEILRRIKNADLRKDDEEKDGHQDEEEAPSDPPFAWLGVECRPNLDHIEIRTVYDPGPSAGLLYPGDEIVAIDTIRVRTADDLQTRIRADWRPGDTVLLQLFRRGRLETVSVTVGQSPPNEYKIRRVKDPSATQRALYESWLKTEWPST